MGEAFKHSSESWRCGIDKVSVAMFEENLEQSSFTHERLEDKGTFVPKPLRRVWIAKDPKN